MVLHAGLIDERILYETGVRAYYKTFIRVEAECGHKGKIILPPFTGKVAKTLLIKANPAIETVFTGAFNPKPIHVSPLQDAGGRWLWRRGVKGGLIAAECGGEYGVHIGYTEDIQPMVEASLENMFDIELYGAKWSIVELETVKHQLPSREPKIRIDGMDKVTVYIHSPALLLDPYKSKPSNPRYLPLPGILFAYNIGDLLRMHSGEFRSDEKYWVIVDTLNAALHEHRRILDHIWTAEYNYDGRIGYGVAGSPTYYFVRRIIDGNPAIKLLIENILLHATIMGVGSGRANGFGHVTVKLVPRQNGVEGEHTPSDPSHMKPQS